MSFREILTLVSHVVLTPEVIGATVVILLFLDLVFYVASYRKRQKKKAGKRKAPRLRKVQPAAPQAPAEGEEGASI